MTPVVFRVEAGTLSAASWERTVFDADCSARVVGDDAVNLNFEVFERAMEFLLRARPGARLKVFEVEEGWFRALRSRPSERGVPAPVTDRPPGAPAGQATPLPCPPGLREVTGRPRTVNVRFGQGQPQLPGVLIPELNEFIVPGSGRIVKFTT